VPLQVVPSLQIALALLLVVAGALETGIEAPPNIEPDVEFDVLVREPRDEDVVVVDVEVDVAAAPLSLQLCTP